MDATWRQLVQDDVPRGLEVKLVVTSHGEGPMRTAVEEEIVVRVRRRGRREMRAPFLVGGVMFAVAGAAVGAYQMGVVMGGAVVAAVVSARLRTYDVLRIGRSHLHVEDRSAVALGDVRDVEMYPMYDAELNAEVQIVSVTTADGRRVVVGRFDDPRQAAHVRALVENVYRQYLRRLR